MTDRPGRYATVDGSWEGMSTRERGAWQVTPKAWTQQCLLSSLSQGPHMGKSWDEKMLCQHGRGLRSTQMSGRVVMIRCSWKRAAFRMPTILEPQDIVSRSLGTRNRNWSSLSGMVCDRPGCAVIGLPCLELSDLVILVIRAIAWVTKSWQRIIVSNKQSLIVDHGRACGAETDAQAQILCNGA
ncbi:hypothetical protein T440DRAFT_5223 [Plenodomus tracheiphilus IPT5]|uniref:Uncharacterized protein n=1 Tax=Plenodomus tracheiphilus IPT5 TaxID=1408161 RepID=A0A6A7BMP7_9PLEO|nr:hypothetical protein T440DRAFT_5223 [Plenodomus tracheiphilus IPT5]